MSEDAGDGREVLSTAASGARHEPDWTRIFPDADHRWLMGLRPADPAAFLAPRDDSGAVRAERARWLLTDPEKYAALSPGAEGALRDTVALARSLGQTMGDASAPFEQVLALGRTWDFDFVWMHPDDVGSHRLVGGAVCFPSSWALRDKLGCTMSETHRPVPGLNDALDRQIETFFGKMAPGAAWQRENANFSRVPDLNQHPSLPRPRLDATTPVDEFWIRLEHQLLLKLAPSGSILFAIRVEVAPLAKLKEHPQGAVRLARLLETMSIEAARYKDVLDARASLVGWLRET